MCAHIADGFIYEGGCDADVALPSGVPCPECGDTGEITVS